jgi:hypothetical protein
MGWTYRKHRFLCCCLLIHCCRDVFTAPLHINVHGATLLLLRTFASMGMCLPSRCLAIKYSSFQPSCHIAPSLKLFILNGPQPYRHFFYSEGCAWFHLPSQGSVFPRCLLSNHSHCSLLKAAHPKRLPDKVPVCPGLSQSSCFSNWWRQNYLEWPVLLHLRLLLCVQSLFSVLEGAKPSTMSSHFP